MCSSTSNAQTRSKCSVDSKRSAVSFTRRPLSLTRFFYGRATLKATFFGDGLATRDFPLLCGLYQRGELELDALVSERIGLDGLEAAFTAMERGETLRSVITFPPAAGL